jgi:hypothetical protein
MRSAIYLTTLVMCCLLTISGCEENPIDTIYTNPDAIVDIINSDNSAEEAHDPDFIATGSYYSLSSVPAGDFGTTSFKLELDSILKTYDVVIGDTIEINTIRAREANATVQYENHYTLTLQNNQDVQVIKHLSTNPNRATKNSYFLQLGSFSEARRGWKFWGTSVLMNLATAAPNISWFSRSTGALPLSSGIIMRTDFNTLTAGDSITVEYIGHSTDIAFLTINENGTPRRVSFRYVDGTRQKAGWKVSTNPSGKSYYYYAGVEIYRVETLGSSDTTKTDILFSGLMYRVEE